jgi:hypothetical protein
MNGAASRQPTGRRSALSIRGHIKSLSRLRLRQPVRFKIRWPEQLPDTSKTLWRCLLVTLGVDGLVAVALAVGELQISTTPFALLGAGILFGVGIANFWGLYSLLQASPARLAGYQRSWAREAFVAQVLVLSLALYVIVRGISTDPETMLDTFKSHNWRAVAVLTIAGAFGLLALVWIVLLGGRAQIRFTITTLLITALIPLSGGLQFWLQDYYLPGSSAPQVDVSAELSPQTKTGPITHLSAKVTMHNRGTSKVYIAGALMRVTAYPKTTHQPEAPYDCRFYADQHWCQVEGGVDISGVNNDADFRADPDSTPAINAHLLYAGSLTGGPGAYMVPGETDTLQREVDIDSGKFRLARLSVSAVFLPERRIADVKSCYISRNASASTDYRNFSREVGEARLWSDRRSVPIIDEKLLQRYLCMNYEIAPSDLITSLIGKPYVMQVRMDLSDPQDPGNEYPMIEYGYDLADKQGNPLRAAQRVSTKISKAIPATVQNVVSEYAPGEPIQPEKN